MNSGTKQLCPEQETMVFTPISKECLSVCGMYATHPHMEVAAVEATNVEASCDEVCLSDRMAWDICLACHQITLLEGGMLPEANACLGLADTLTVYHSCATSTEDL
ncbi:hypothetical protein ABBQ38_014856 [Trebouxia sp. C0009 RCD-2024]